MSTVKVIYSLNRTIIFAAFLFLAFSLYFGLVGYKEDVKGYLLFNSFLLGWFYLVALFVSSRKKSYIDNKSLFNIVFIYSVFLSFLLRYLFLEYTGEMFQEARDSYTYDEEALSSIKNNRSIVEHLQYIDNSWSYGLSVDDYGFNVVVYVIYSLFGVDLGRWIMILVNGVCISLSSVCMSRIFRTLKFGFKTTNVCVSVFAFFSFFPITAAVGLKENVFLLFIVASILYIITYNVYHKQIVLYKALLCIICTFLFRLPIGVMLVVVLLASLVINQRNYKRMMVMSLLILLLIGIFLGVAFEFVFGISLEHVLTVSENRIGEDNSIGWYIQLLGAVTGPFPNYSRAVQYGILSSFAIQIKCLLNYFALYSIYSIFIKGDYKYFWICFYYLMGLLMLTVAAVSLDMRYHVTFFPILVILVGYALDRKIINKWLYILYTLFTVLIIYNYNIR